MIIRKQKDVLPNLPPPPELEPRPVLDREQTEKQKIGKLNHFLVPVEVEEGIAEVYEYGAKKYNEDNYRMGFPSSYYYSAIRRHLSEVMKGKDLDPESDIHHLFHIAANCLMWWTNLEEGKDEKDDRSSKQIDRK